MGRYRAGAVSRKRAVISRLQGFQRLDTPDNQPQTPTAPQGRKKPGAASKAFSHSAGVFSSNLWKSRLSWRIALTAFAAIMFVQMAALGITLYHFEDNKLEKLREISRNYIVSSLNDKKLRGKPVLITASGNNAVLAAEATVTGIAIYDGNFKSIAADGEKTLLQPKRGKNLPPHTRIAAGSEYELSFTPKDLGRPYHAVLRVQTDIISPLIIDHIYGMTAIALFFSVLSTGLIMVALGKWILEPLLVLSANLSSAAKNAERPNLLKLPREPNDEVGSTLRVASELIKQNANNLKRLRAQAEDKIHRLAYYDSLTGLPNRTFFVEKLDEAIKRKVVQEDRRIAVFCVDLDHFKDINDTMGHEFGDRLLEIVGSRLVTAMPSGAVIARASADEFSIMVVHAPGAPDSQTISEAIFDAMREPVSILHEQFQIRVSVGVSHCPDDGMDGRQLLKNADIALNRAKEEGRDTIRFYSEAFDIAVQQRFQILRDLRKALENNELQLHYQPQIDLRTGDIVGVEALLRWYRKNDDGTETFIPPGDFIAIAEQSSLIVPIGAWVLKTACRANKQWQDSGMKPFRVAVNISGIQFHRADIVDLVKKTLAETNLDPKYLELELTESIFMENIDGAIGILRQLNALGVEMAVDDFGTGYSSLSYLRQFPIDRLKIDQSFMRNALTNRDDGTIAKTIISLGHSLDLKVIAEGVETQEQLEFLLAEGCDEAQGFKYSRALPSEALVKFIDDYYTSGQPSAFVQKVAAAE